MDIENLQKLIKKDITDIIKIGIGKNSVIYKINCTDFSEYAIKKYSQDNRNRLHNEFAALEFLCNNGIKYVPKPIAKDELSNFGIYEYINGKNMRDNKIFSKDLGSAINFINDIKLLIKTKEAKKIGNASAACFKFSDYVDIIEKRLSRLIEVEDPHLSNYLNSVFIPIYNNIKESFIGKEFNEIKDYERTLSPSDFGFHNAIKKDRDEIIFIDFEYFGWDDPAKLISDFIINPGMNLDDKLKKQFVQNMLLTFDQENILDRLMVTYPLCGLIWCLIFLNEFVPEYLNRRDFASSVKKENQLEKSKTLLEKINDKKDYISRLM